MARKVYNWDKLPVLLDTDTVGLILNLKPGTVCKRCRDGTLPTVRAGHAWKIPRDALRSMLGQSPVRSAASAELPPLSDDMIDMIAVRVAAIVVETLHQHTEKR